MEDLSFWDRLFGSFMFWKALALLGVIGVATFLYRFITGRDIAELFNGTDPSAKAARSGTAADRPQPPQAGQ